jgi:peptidyl-prolyl cis-trans isomerase SurA
MPQPKQWDRNKTEYDLNMMQKNVTLVRAFILFACGVLVCSAVHAQPKVLREGDDIDGIVAVVGKYPILKSTIEAQLQLLLYQNGKTSPPEDTVAFYRNQILQSEIDQKALLVKAEADTLITVSESEIDEQLDNRISQYERQFGSRAEMEKAFGKTVAEIKASQDLRDRAREQIYIEKLRGNKFSKPPAVSRRDVQEFYSIYKDSLPDIGKEQVELGTIVKLIKPPAGEKMRMMQFAKKIVDSLRNGGDFADFAKRYSQHPTASSGGDLGGPYPRGTFIPDFEAAAFKLKVNEISDPVETDQGIHIIKLLERKGEEIRVAQVLLKPGVSKDAEDSIYKVILQLRDSLLNGASFGRMAKLYSDDEETKDKGGMLGKIYVSYLGPEQRAALDSLNPGEISRPIKISFSKTTNGFQIVKLIRRVKPHKPTIEGDYDELEYTAKQWKQMKEYEKFVADARKDVYIDIRK